MSSLDKMIARAGDKDFAHRLIDEASDNTLVIVLARDADKEELAMTVVGGYEVHTTDLLGLLQYGTIVASRKFDDGDSE